MDELPRRRRPVSRRRTTGYSAVTGFSRCIRLYAGRPFALGEHLDRLERSAAAIELPVEREALESEISVLLGSSVSTKPSSALW